MRPHKKCVAVGNYTPASVEAALIRRIQQSLPHLSILTWNEFVSSPQSSDAEDRTMFAIYLLTTCMGVQDIARLDVAVLVANGYDLSADRYIKPKSAFMHGGNRGVENNMFDQTIDNVAGAFCYEYQRLNPKKEMRGQ